MCKMSSICISHIAYASCIITAPCLVATHVFLIMSVLNKYNLLTVNNIDVCRTVGVYVVGACVTCAGVYVLM